MIFGHQRARKGGLSRLAKREGYGFVREADKLGKGGILRRRR